MALKRFWQLPFWGAGMAWKLLIQTQRDYRIKWLPAHSGIC